MSTWSRVVLTAQVGRASWPCRHRTTVPMGRPRATQAQHSSLHVTETQRASIARFRNTARGRWPRIGGCCSPRCRGVVPAGGFVGRHGRVRLGVQHHRRSTRSNPRLAWIHRADWCELRVVEPECPCDAGELVLSRDRFQRSRRASGRCECLMASPLCSMTRTSCRARVWRRCCSWPSGRGWGPWSRAWSPARTRSMT